jgi:hypothetical protein
MSYFRNLNCQIEKDPNFTILMSLIVGFLFAGISWGLIYVIIFLILWEIAYFAYLDCNGKSWSLESRVTIILAALLGFLLGANLHDKDDHYDHCGKFKEDIDYYGKEFEWF